MHSRWYRTWTTFILLWAVYSSFITPLEFGFFRGLPGNLFILDLIGQVAFLVDIVLQFFVAYRDSQTYRMVYKRTPIALRLVSILSSAYYYATIHYSFYVLLVFSMAKGCNCLQGSIGCVFISVDS